MANISDEELRQRLFPQETLAFLDAHPSCYARAGKMYLTASIKNSAKGASYEIDRATKKLQNVIRLKNSLPEVF